MRGPSGIGGWGRDQSWGGNPNGGSGGGLSAPRQTSVKGPTPMSMVEQFMPLARPNPAMNMNNWTPVADQLGKYLQQMQGNLTEGGYFNPRDQSDYEPGNIGEMFQGQGGSQGGRQGQQLDYDIPDYKGMMSQLGNFADFQRPDLMGIAQMLMQYKQPDYQGQTSSMSDMSQGINQAGMPPAYAGLQQQMSDMPAVPPQQLIDFMSMPRPQYNYG